MKPWFPRFARDETSASGQPGKAGLKSGYFAEAVPPAVSMTCAASGGAPAGVM